MDKKIKKILNLNLLCYINNFIYIFASNKMEIKGLLELWVLTPFIFLFLTSFILENKCHREHIYLKKYALSDFIIRFMGACIAFTELGLSFEIKIPISIFFMIFNIIIELRMLKIKPRL